MARDPFGAAYRRLGAAYPRWFARGELLAGFAIAFVTVVLMRSYQSMSGAQFVRLLLVAEACTLVAVVVHAELTVRLLAPVTAWIEGRRDDDATIAAWRGAISAPHGSITGGRAILPLMIVGPVFGLYAVNVLNIPLASSLLIMLGVAVATTYAVILHYFVLELGLRPVVRELAAALPRGYYPDRTIVPIRRKLIASVPLINAITAVIASTLAAPDGATFADLGAGVLFAVVVALTVSLTLTLLLSNSITEPVQAMKAAADRVRTGDLSGRVPAVSADEIGQLAQGFNRMIEGLAERELLSEALGSYVTPEVSSRLMSEGTSLEPMEVAVTVMFVDIRDFTEFSARSSPEVVVGRLNELFALAVPIVTAHGGHVNKFIGDGLLAVFGAPSPCTEHPDRAVACALAITRRVGVELPGLEIGIGVNTGPVVSGTVGGGGRLEFTVVGDTVNVAARVEAATRQTGDLVLITEATRDQLLSAGDLELLERPAIELKGVARAQRLYAVSRGT